MTAVFTNIDSTKIMPPLHLF